LKTSPRTVFSGASRAKAMAAAASRTCTYARQNCSP
jgi:hypothetical protein